MWLTFDRMLRNLLLSEASKIMPSAVVNTDASEVELVLTTSLIELLCDYLGNSIADVFECYGCAQQYGNELGHECITLDYETRIRLYGDLALFTIDFEQLLSRILSSEIFKC
ncbi:PC4 domain-containing protein [Trichonephila inaurata madagascariensis]|uniref:PC4 domain-containing protein n=1 Tax=Trichonephila inaurata madagascariensis TaxID=2747483 RepID=A0A8X6K4D3_9ARAC|nr:PC4 domain-containing protein [Trichonephila inaurata madagascariensis]